MLKKIIEKCLNKAINSKFQEIVNSNEELLLTNGRILSNQQYNINSENLCDYEFKVFSQFGDDGIIQYLIKNIKIENDSFIEFGVENYMESNTRFLLMNNNWRGFVMDGSDDAINSLKNRPWFWMYDLTAKSVFIDKDNINSLLGETGFENIGLLHIDLDGNDYWILEALNFSKLTPAILICEYNSVFGKDRAICTPYDKSFYRTEKHYSNLYWGASLKALTNLANKKGYSLVGSNSAGNNAYFVRNDLLNDTITEKSVDEVFVKSKYRESRDKNGTLTYIRGDERLTTIKGLEVINILDYTTEKL